MAVKRERLREKEIKATSYTLHTCIQTDIEGYTIKNWTIN